MSEQYDHYQRAEALLAEGEKVVGEITSANQARKRVLDDSAQDVAEGGAGHRDVKSRYDAITSRMDELGKKAQGIWAQAQVHATLAQTPNWVVSAGWTPAPKYGTEYLTAGHDLSEGGTR